MAPSASRIAIAHGVTNLVGGLWPLLHLRSFEAVFGPKVDRWLVKTVSGLLVVNGVSQLTSGRSKESTALARRLGIGTAGVLAAIDLVHVPTGRISPMYLLDCGGGSGLDPALGEGRPVNVRMPAGPTGVTARHGQRTGCC